MTNGRNSPNKLSIKWMFGMMLMRELFVNQIKNFFSSRKDFSGGVHKMCQALILKLSF